MEPESYYNSKYSTTILNFLTTHYHTFADNLRRIVSITVKLKWIYTK